MANQQAVANVTLTSLNYNPGCRIVCNSGFLLHLHFIKECWGMNGKGLLGTFYCIYLSAVNVATRAQYVVSFLI
jgi:hypothetical protein